MLPTASPESVGLSAERLQAAFAQPQGWLADGTVSAVAAVVARRGRMAGEFYGGRTDAGENGRAVNSSTLFHIASIGKPMTATAVMMLVEAGKVSLDDPLSDYVPQFKGEWRDAITIRRLLTHTSGLPQDPGPEITEQVERGSGTDALLKHYHRTRLAAPVGSKVEYSNVGYGMLGLVIEAVSGKPFATFLRERLFAPAGMSEAYLAPPDSTYARIAQVDGVPDAGGTFERFNSRYARTLTNPGGSVIATAGDVAAFFQMFLDGGKAHGRAVLAPATTRLMTTNQTTGLRGGIEGFMTWDECAWGLGFDMRAAKRPHFSGEFTSPRTFGHSGVAGTFAWADPERELVCVMLGNHILHNLWNHPRWSRFSSAVCAAVTD
ncbi:MAG: beta-lactamase family protein [Chloroflexi bacterium]|nr:beta-lactamase family protein [Chloroflexota bacterium]